MEQSGDLAPGLRYTLIMRRSVLWQHFPKWLQRVTLFVALPAWLAFAAMILTGSIFDHEKVMLGLFGVLAMVGILQMIFAARAFGGPNATQRDVKLTDEP